MASFINLEAFFSSIRVSRPESNLIVFESSRWFYIIALSGMLAFMAFWYGIGIFRPNGPDKSNLFWFALFYLAPLASIPYLIQYTSKLIRPLKLTFNTFTKTICSTHDIDSEVPFSDVQHIQIRSIPYDSSYERRVSLLLKNGNKLSVFRTTGTNRAGKIADQLAVILKVAIKAQ